MILFTKARNVGLNNKFERDIDELKKHQPSIDGNSVKNDENKKIEYNDKKARLWKK